MGRPTGPPHPVSHPSFYHQTYKRPQISSLAASYYLGTSLPCKIQVSKVPTCDSEIDVFLKLPSVVCEFPSSNLRNKHPKAADSAGVLCDLEHQAPELPPSNSKTHPSLHSERPCLKTQGEPFAPAEMSVCWALEQGWGGKGETVHAPILADLLDSAPTSRLAVSLVSVAV